MSQYRLSFLEGLAKGPVSPTFAPRRTVWYGTTADLLQARKDRSKRIYQVLLIEAGDVDDPTMAYLWDKAQELVMSGRDLQ